MSLIYHITRSSDWEKGKASGSYYSASLKEEGFIHCSEQEQLDGVRSRYFSGAQDLVLLTIDTQKLTSQLIFEWSPSLEQTFPHIYGPINVDAVVSAGPF